MRTSTGIEAFVAGWIDAWNRRDVEWVLARFAEDTVFTSPTADQVTGSPVVRGKAALREYWTAALARRTAPLDFELDHALWDEAQRELAIVFTRRGDPGRVRACELLRFGADGLVIEGEALHGARL